MTRAELEDFFTHLAPGNDGADHVWAPAIKLLRTPGEYLLEYEGKALQLTVSEEGAEAVELASGADFPPLKAALDSIPIDERRAQQLIRWTKGR